MKFFYNFLGFCLVALAFSSCSTNKASGPGSSVIGGTGPFDKHGNYVEAWADNPSKWRKGSHMPTADDTRDIPHIAASDQPPSHSIPISTPPSRKPPVEVATRSRPASQSSPPVRQTASRSNETQRPKATASSVKSKSTAQATAARSNVQSTTKSKAQLAKTQATQTRSSTTAKTKATAAKTKTAAASKPKPKAKTTRVIVKKGDSLSAIASRNGTTVAALKRENGISGTIIRPGQSLVIPK